MPLDIPLGTETEGYTVTIDGRTYRAFLVDAAGHIQADVLSSALPSGAATLAEQQTQTIALQLIDDLRNALAAVAADYLRTQLHGWDGSAWQKLNLLWGYSDRYAERKVNTDAAAGTNTLDFTAVPAGEVWVVNSIAAVDQNSAITAIWITANLAGVNYFLLVQASPVAGTWYFWNGNIVMKAGDYIQVFFLGTVLNDDIDARACGYKMKVA